MGADQGHRLCVEIPFANGRVFERGDEYFLRSYFKHIEGESHGEAFNRFR